MPLTVALLDIDHFKMFNDLHGHDAGDEVLRELGAVLGEAVRSNDIACRYGGEELLLVLPECNAATAQARLEQICLKIKQKKLVFGGRLLQTVTISAGVAQLSDELSSADELITAADRALYAAKRAGRDRIERYSSPLMMEKPAA